VKNINKHEATGRPSSPIIDVEGARGLTASGWGSADLHVHTLHSYDVIPTRQTDPLRLYHEARRLGMTFVAFTDHDTMDAYDRIGWTREGLVPAVEIKILDPKRVGHTVHINVYALDRNQFREIQRVIRTAGDIEILTDYLKGESLPFVFNHPFWHEAGEKINLQAVLDIVDLFPVLEYNMGRIARLNAQALRLAEARGRGIMAATDTHIGEIAKAFTVAPGKTFGEFFGSIQRGQSRIVPADLTLARLKGETAIRLRQLFDKAGWISAKDSLTIDTGSAILDRVVTRMAKTRLGQPCFADRLLERLLAAVSRTGIPGSLYFRSQRNLANRVCGFLTGAGATA
jgi:predicted metal-dependent phosphoesterase TrpH